MHTSKFKWMRLAMVLVIGLLALSPLAPTQSAKAQPPQTGILCTTGPTFSLTAQTGYIQTPDMNTVYMWSYGLTDGSFNTRSRAVRQSGDTVTVILTNDLPYGLSTSIIFLGRRTCRQMGSLPSRSLMGQVTSFHSPKRGTGWQRNL
jgi:hypothetical protein